MTARSALRAVVILATLCPCVVLSQVGAYTIPPSLTQNLANNQFGELEAYVAAACKPHRDIASSRNHTIFERREAAERAVACVNGYQASATVAVLAADPANPIRANVISALLKPLADETKNEEEKRKAATDFMGFTWGVGFGFSVGKETVESAVIADNIVRATGLRKQEPRLVLEFHRYFWCNDNYRDETRGCGPFLAVVPSNDNILAVGLGMMYGFRRPDDKNNDGFSLGAGFVLDSKVKTLGDGFTQNAPPPAGETTVRFEEKSRWSLLIFATRTF